MKHLKTYKLFESNDKLSQDFINIIKDICLDLTDIEYTVNIQSSNRRYLLEIEIEADSKFDNEVLKSVFKNIRDVVSEYDLSVEVYIPYSDSWLSINYAISSFDFSDYKDITLEIG